MGLTVYGGGGKPEEEKTVTAGTSVIEVNPSSGKVMKKVTVNPTPTESKSVTPTTSELTVTPSAGKHLSQVVVGAVEDVTPEVTAQTPVITQIAENLGVTITIPSGTNKQILQGNNSNLQSISTNAKKSGQYVWKKLTAQGGDFIDFVVSDSETAYPDGGEQGGYWYEKVSEGITPELFGFTKYAIDKFTPTSDQKDRSTPLSHSLGIEPKFIYMIAIEQPTSTSVTMSYIATEFWATRPDATSFTKSSQCKHIVHSSYQGGYVNGDSSVSVTTSTLTFDGGSHFKAGIEYTLITMA